MNPKLLAAFALLITGIFICPGKASASHAAGGELLYEWLQGNTYRVVFKFYRDCSGIPEPQFQQLCIYNPCNNTGMTSNMEKAVLISGGRPNGSQVDVGCPDYKNTCEDRNSSIPGYREWWYEDTVTLSGKCNMWKFTTSISLRNGSNNIQGGNSVNFHIEATLNNTVYNNSSPVFSTKPVPYVCINSPYTYNNGAIDRDNDSLVFETVMPLSGNVCHVVSPVVTFPGKTPALNLISNPFQTNNTYAINPNTGNISFIPSELGPQTTAIKVTEYKNGVVVGSTMRDIQVQVLPCTSVPIKLSLDTLSIVNASMINGVIEACAFKLLNFCYDISTTVPNTILAVSDNKNLAVPGASITYTNNATSTVRGCFSWTPLAADTGLKILTITAKDSTCTAPGIAISQTFTIPIKINIHAPLPAVISPINICQYSPPLTLTAAGNNLLWYNAPVGGVGSANPPIANTSLTGKQTFYVAHVPNGCESPRSRIDVFVLTSPEVELIVPDDTICAYEKILLEDSIANKDTIGYIWNIESAQIEYTANPWRVYSAWSQPGWNKIIVEASNSNCTTRDSADIYVLPTPRAFFHVYKNACVTRPVIVEPTEVDARYSWEIDDFSISDTIFKPTYSITWPAIGKRYINLTVTGNNGCKNTYTDSVSVHPLPIAEILPGNSNICKGREFTLNATEGFRYKYSWSPPQFFTNNSEIQGKGVAEKTGYVYLDVANEWNCTSRDSFLINGEPCCEIVMPDAFTPDGNGQNDVFKPVNPGNKTLAEFLIANRRGQIIFKTSDISKGWDGTHDGKPAGQDTYNYYIRYLCDGIEENITKGTVILLR